MNRFGALRGSLKVSIAPLEGVADKQQSGELALLAETIHGAACLGDRGRRSPYGDFMKKSDSDLCESFWSYDNAYANVSKVIKR